MFWRSVCCAALACILFLPPSVKAGEGEYSMESAVMRALEKNPDLEGAGFSVQAAESARKAARSSFGPELGVTYSYSRYSKERSSRSEKNATTMTVQASQPLFTGFNLLNTYQKAALEVDLQKLELESQRLTVTASVQEAFISYLKALECISSTQRSLERSRAQLDMAKTAWNIGLRPRLDVLQAETDLAQTEALLISYENDRDVWLTRLNTLLDLPPDARTTFSGDLDVQPFRRTLEACLGQALEHRPDLLMARKSVEIAFKDLGITKSLFWPQLSAIVGWSTTGSHLDAAGSRYSRKDYSYGEIGLSLDWTLFSSGRRVFLTRQAQQQISALESAVRSSVNNCAYAVRSGLLSTQDAYRAVKVSQRAVASARESYADAKMRYELQSGSYLDLLIAQSALSDAELAEISNRADCLIALAHLYETMGELRPDLKEPSSADASADRNGRS